MTVLSHPGVGGVGVLKSADLVSIRGLVRSLHVMRREVKSVRL